MQKKGFYNYMRTCVVMVSLALVMFSTTSCHVLCGCENPGGYPVSKGIKKDQEMLAKNENPNGTKTGMILSFKSEDNNKSQNVAVAVPEAGYKDFSFRYVAEESDCPLSQEGRHTHVTAGPNMNFKSAGSDVYPNGKHHPGIGFQVGFQTVYRFNEKFSVVPGLIFKQNNAKETGEITEGGEPPYNESYKIEDKYSYNYLSAPILAQYNLTESLSLSAGPEINYLLSAKVNSTRTFGGEDQKEKRNISDESVRLGVGVQAGVKYEFPDSRWSLELLYDHRLSRLNKKPEDYPYPTEAWRMKSVQLSAKCRICDLVKGPKHNQSSSKN
jgi:hypothetical protein